MWELFDAGRAADRRCFLRRVAPMPRAGGLHRRGGRCRVGDFAFWGVLRNRHGNCSRSGASLNLLAVLDGAIEVAASRVDGHEDREVVEHDEAQRFGA